MKPENKKKLEETEKELDRMTERILQKRRNENNQRLAGYIVDGLAEILKPFLTSKLNVSIPEIKIPEIKIPEIKIPPFPKEMMVEGVVGLKGIDRDNPLPVILTDEDGRFYKAIMTAISSGGGGRMVEIIKPGTASIFNLTLTNLDTEYSQRLPDNTIAMTFQCRGAYDIRFAYETGKVASPTAPYMTLKAGMIYYETNLKLTGKTIYCASATAAQVVEIICYH